MRRLFRQVRRCAVILFACASAAGCGPASTPGSSRSAGGGAHFIDATYSEPKTFNPILASEVSSTDQLALMIDQLVYRNPFTLEFEPMLAERWEAGADGKRWVFHLRKEAKWSDGQPFTAEDVLFSFNLIYDKSIPSVQREGLTFAGKTLACRVMDRNTVEFTSPVRIGPILAAIATAPMLPRHKLETIWKAGAFKTAWALNTPPADLVGTGPFVLVKYTPGQGITFKRNSLYWRKGADGSALPHLDGGVSQIVPDRNTLVLRFQSKETDYVWLRPEDWSPLQGGQAAGDYKTYNCGPSWSFTYLSFNVNPANTKLPEYKREWFRRKEFRQAVSYALDRDNMVTTVLRGMGAPIWSPVPVVDKVNYNANLKPTPYDPSRSAALLAQMGLSKKNAEGVLVDAAGHPVEFTLLTNNNNNIRLALCTAIQEHLRKIGIKVNVLPVEFNSLVEKLRATYDWEADVLGFTATAEPYTGRNIWMSSGVMHIWHPFQKAPDTPWEAEIDRIFDAAASEPDVKRRKALYDRWQEIMYDQQPMVCLITEGALAAVHNRIEHVRPNPLPGPTLPFLRWNSYEFSAR